MVHRRQSHGVLGGLPSERSGRLRAAQEYRPVRQYDPATPKQCKVLSLKGTYNGRRVRALLKGAPLEENVIESYDLATQTLYFRDAWLSDLTGATVVILPMAIRVADAPSVNEVYLDRYCSNLRGYYNLKVAQLVGRGSVQGAGAAGRFCARTDPTPADGYYDGWTLTFTSGDLDGQSRTVTRSGNDEFSFDVPWAATPQDGWHFELRGPEGTVSSFEPLPFPSGTVDGSPMSDSFVGGGNLDPGDGVYQDRLLRFTSGALVGRSQPIQFYEGISHRFTFAFDWQPAPAPGDQFVIDMHAGARLTVLSGWPMTPAKGQEVEFCDRVDPGQLDAHVFMLRRPLKEKVEPQSATRAGDGYDDPLRKLLPNVPKWRDFLEAKQREGWELYSHRGQVAPTTAPSPREFPADLVGLSGQAGIYEEALLAFTTGVLAGERPAQGGLLLDLDNDSPRPADVRRRRPVAVASR